MEYMASNQGAVRLGILDEELSLTKSLAHFLVNELVRLA